MPSPEDKNKKKPQAPDQDTDKFIEELLKVILYPEVENLIKEPFIQASKGSPPKDPTLPKPQKLVSKSKTLKNSEELDIEIGSDATEVDQAIEALWCELKSVPGFKGYKNIWQKHIKVLSLNLYKNWLDDPAKYTSYHRHKNHYSEIPKRYNKNKISYTLVKVATLMADMGYINDHTGYFDKAKPENNFVSRMIATPKLIHFFTDRFHFNPLMLGKNHHAECIILRKEKRLKKKSKTKKGFKKRQVDVMYTDTPETIRMRKNLYAYNNLLRRSFIDIPNIKDGKSLLYPTEKKININRSNKFVRRIFNNESWDNGGRFYGGWWQQLPEEIRTKILIEGQPVVEIDYSGQHIIMLYAMKGIDYWKETKDDPYLIDGCEKSSRMRGVLKKVFNASINSAKFSSAIQAIQATFHRDEASKKKYAWVKDEGIKVKTLVEKFTDHHSRISDFFFSGIGIKLQKFDSMMAEYVIVQFTYDKIPVLCVHDSFIVPSLEEPRLRKLMEKAFDYVMRKARGQSGEFEAQVSLEGLSQNEYMLMIDKKEPYELGTTLNMVYGSFPLDFAYVNRHTDHMMMSWENEYFRCD
jgi:hypothetical protein